MKKLIVLIILLLGILFPFAAMTRFSTGYAEAFNAVFDSLLSHILMHAALFAALSWVIISFSSKKPMKTIFFLCLGSVLLIAVAQEALQMISTHTSDFGAALFDLGIDLIGGLIPLVVYVFTKNKLNGRVDHG